MKIRFEIRILLACIISVLGILDSLGCSMYKVTLHSKTLVGTNFDAYYTSPRIWFEVSNSTMKYGAAFSGGRIDGDQGFAPQSGMNEAGLSFSRLAAPTPESGQVDMSSKIKITKPTLYLKDILHNCATIKEVKQYIEKHDHSSFMEDVFIYIEPSGNYLVVEPYTLTEGTDSNYVLSNFCPSVTTSTYAHNLQRYHKGVELIKQHVDTSLAFATTLIDTMHVCREKLGDGTLLSSIWDLKNGLISLYFYHDYKHLIQYDLKNELSKGDHYYELKKIFPPNKEFEKFINYQLPHNNLYIRFAFLYCLGIFSFSLFYFLILALKKRIPISFKTNQLILLFLSIILFYYIYILSRHTYIVYYAAPYKDYKFSMLDIASYIPIFTLPFFIIQFISNFKIIQSNQWKRFPTVLFTFNSVAYILLISLFLYWELYILF